MGNMNERTRSFSSIGNSKFCQGQKKEDAEVRSVGSGSNPLNGGARRNQCSRSQILSRSRPDSSGLGWAYQRGPSSKMVEYLPRLHHNSKGYNVEEGTDTRNSLASDSKGRAGPMAREMAGDIWAGNGGRRLPISFQERSHQSRHARRCRQDGACRLHEGWLQRRVHSLLPQVSTDRCQ